MDKNLISLHNKFKQIHTLKKFNEVVRTEKIDIAPAKILTEAVKVPEKAIAVQALALNINIGLEEQNKAFWQHYWLRCCLSEECDYIFSILSAESIDINREEDLIKIINGNVIDDFLSSGAKKYYLTVCIDFLLKRYNLIDAWKLCFKYFDIINLSKLLLPRMLSAILVGFILIASSQELMDFGAKISKSGLFNYALIFTFLISFFYFFLECYDVIRWSLPKNDLNSEIILRIILILLWGLVWSTIFSYVFIAVNLLHSDSALKFSWELVVVYASFSFFIGILIQLLWEEKTVTEPLFH